MAADSPLTLRELPVLPGGEHVAIWSIGIINEVPAFVRTARINGRAEDPCRPDLLMVQGEKFKLAGQYAEAAMVLAASALHRHCKGQVWYAPKGQTPRLRADLRGEWHDAVGIKALQSGQSPQALSYENQDFPRTATKPLTSAASRPQVQCQQEHLVDALLAQQCRRQGGRPAGSDIGGHQQHGPLR